VSILALALALAPVRTLALAQTLAQTLALTLTLIKVSGESDRTGQGPFDVVLSAVLDAAQEKQGQSEKATLLQASWTASPSLTLTRTLTLTLTLTSPSPSPSP